MSGDRVLTTPVPSLAQWLGDGMRADGFEQWVGQSLTMPADLSADEARFLRMAQTFAVACVETMRRETGEVPDAELIGAALAQWARATGYVTMAAAASVLVDDAPFRRLARIWGEEFRLGAKAFADSFARRQRSDPHA